MKQYTVPELELLRLFSATIYTVSEEAEWGNGDENNNWDDYLEEEANGTSDDA